MMGLPVAVFLHNRFSGSPLSFLFFFLRAARGRVLGVPWATFSPPAGPFATLSRSPQSKKRPLPSSPLLPISPYVGSVHTPRARRARASERVQLAGGCILITFMSSDIPARFIAPAPADSAKTRRQPPSFRVPPFLRSPPALARYASSFFSSSGSPLVLRPAQSTPCDVLLPSL